MRETQFIKQNQEKWSEFEETLKGEAKDADRLRNLLVQITDDLSYTRTFYPNRSVRVYLNSLAQKVFLQLYRNRRTPLGKLVTFWTDELPQEIYRARSAFRLAFFLFVLCFGIGVLSCAMDAEFAEVVLGDDYVEMTRANIESGDPMAVYKEKGAFSMFLGITFNNLYVAFLAFTMGVFFGVGSIVILVSNAIMVGCFQYFFIKEGLFWDSFLTIWIHGTLEISAIVIATAAGITMGHGPAFPGTYTRLQAFQQSARRGAKIMLGTTPLFIIAGFLEGFMTRQTDTPDLIRGAFILICLLFVIVYFVWYPWFYHKMGFHNQKVDTQRLPEDQTYELQTGRIKTSGEIFSEIFVLFRKHSRAMLLAIFGGALAYCLVIFNLSDVSTEELLPFNTESWIFNPYNFVLLFAARDGNWLIPLAGTLMLYLVSVQAFRAIDRELEQTIDRLAYLRLFFGLLLVVLCVCFLSWWLLAIIAFILPLALLFTYVSYRDRIYVFKGIQRVFFLMKGAYWRTVGMSLLLLVLGLTLFSIVNTVVAHLLFQLINWLVYAEQAILDEWSLRMNTFLLASIASFIWMLLFLGTGLLYYTLREINEGTDLRKKLAAIGQGRRIRGLERE
ncbi:MAG: stage II sporulation protein M [Bacteroidota bacterium]